MGGEKKSHLYPSEFSAGVPVTKDKLTREKLTSVLTCALHVHGGELRDEELKEVA